MSPIAAVGTSTAAFLGPTVRGPVGDPRRIAGYSEFVATFGGIRGTASDELGDALGHSVKAYFGNGGSAAFVVRTASNDRPGAPDVDDYGAALDGLVGLREISVLSLPGVYWDGDPTRKAILDIAVSHAEQTRNRMVIVDPPPDTQLTRARQVHDLDLPTSSYAVLYYPWVEVANPHHHAQDPAAPETVLVPPSGFMAGVWARMDGRRGVWKAPAGVETSLRAAAGLRYDVGHREQEVLNPLGVNCLRRIPGFGPVAWGARTLATRADPEWRYIPVRRTAIFLGQSIEHGIRWAVFEPNDHVLWSSLRGTIEAFLDTQFRAGAFRGQKASDAYYVRCGLGQTMTRADIDAGQVIVEIGFALLKPAEFVVIRIQQQAGRQ